MSHIRFICLLLILTVASVMDLRMYKVKNGLILMGFILRLILRIIWPSDGMLAAELAGMLLPLLMIGLYKYSMLGAADIKLFSVSGIYLGLNDCLYTILLTFLIAALFALRKLTAKHQLRKRLLHLRQFLKNYPITKNYQYMDFSKKDEDACIHLTVPMTLASAIVYIYQCIGG